MENRFEHSQPEEQGWGAYVTPPRYPGQPPQHMQQPGETTRSNLCVQVVEMLPSLLENEVRPEMAKAIYAHLAVCISCTHEFEQMRRVVTMVETLKEVEMPMDFSGIIMQRIHTEIGPLRSGPPPHPTVAASSAAFGEVASNASAKAAETHREQLASALNALEATKLRTDASRVGLNVSQVTQSETQLNLRQRLTLAGVLSAVLAFLLSTEWGRAMLNVNLETMNAWFAQMAQTLRSVPVLSVMFAFIFSALAQVGGLLGDTYRSLGAMAARGFVLDVALFAVAYYFLVARRQRGQRIGI